MTTMIGCRRAEGAGKGNRQPTTVVDPMKDSKSLLTTLKFIAVLTFLASLALADALRRTTLVPAVRFTPVPTPVSSAPTPELTASSPTPTQTADSRSVLVWVNTNTGVYHCPNTRWYGKTKSGKYMTQEEAASRGYRPAYGGTCG